MSEIDKKFENFIKNFIKELAELDQENTKPQTKETQKQEEEENIEDFETVLKFIVTSENKLGLIIDENKLKKWNKSIIDVLIDNMYLSLTLLKEKLN